LNLLAVMGNFRQRNGWGKIAWSKIDQNKKTNVKNVNSEDQQEK